MAWSDIAVPHNATFFDVFGRAVTYTPADGVPSTPVVILDPRLTEEEATRGIWGIIRIRATDIPAPARGDMVTIDNVEYKVYDIRAEQEEGCFQLALHQ